MYFLTAPYSRKNAVLRLLSAPALACALLSDCGAVYNAYRCWLTYSIENTCPVTAICVCCRVTAKLDTIRCRNKFWLVVLTMVIYL
jgi:hypothetical protein